MSSITYTSYLRLYALISLSIFTTTASAQNRLSPSQGHMQPVVQTAGVGAGNYTTFFRPGIDKTAEVMAHNKGYETDPELGMSFSNSPANTYELLDKRTEQTKTFIKKGSNGTEYVMVGSAAPLHYKDAQGKWHTIHYDLRLDNAPGVFSVSERAVPVTLNANSGLTSIGIKGTPYNINYNNLELIYIKPDGTEQSLGAASWKNYTAGDDGMYVKDAWPGVDIEMHLIATGLKTNFWLNKAMPQYSGGKLVIRDHMQLGGGLKLAPTGDIVRIEDQKGEEVYEIGRAIAFEKENIKGSMQTLGYVKGEDNSLDIVLPGNYMNRPAAAYPIIIDPVFSATGSATVPNNGSSFDGGLPGSVTVFGCSVTIPATMPAAVTLTDIQGTFTEGIATGIEGHNSAFAFYNPNTGCWVWFQYAGSLIGPASAYISNFSLYPYFCEPPTPQCASYTLNTTMWLSRGMDQSLGACNATDIYAVNTPTVVIYGHTVELNNVPTATPATICLNGCTTLAAAPQYGVPPYTYAWTPGVGGTTASVTVCPTTTTTYSVIATDVCLNTTVVGTTTVTVNPLPPVPTISAGGPTTFCQGQSVVFTASAGTGVNYQWYNGLNPVGTNSQTYTATTAGTYSVTETYTSTGCSSQSAGTVVTVNALPPITISTNSPICAGATLNLNSSSTQSPVSYSWTGPATITNSTSANATVPNAQAANSGIYTVTVTNTSTSCSNTATVAATINALPPITISSNSPICAGATLNLNSSTTQSPVTYAWTGPATITNSASANATVPNAQPANSGVYTVTVNNTSTSCSNTATVSATINALPPITISSNSPICAGSTLNLNSSTTQSPVTYSWTGPATITNPTSANATVPNAQPANSGTYTVSVTNTSTSCSNTATVSATINAKPPITISSNSPICAGATLNLNSSTTQSPVTYAWTGPATITNATSANATVPNAQAANSGVYTVTVTNTSTSCSNTATVSATINALPPITISSNSPICAGVTLNLNSSTTQSPVSYAWTGPATITNSTSANATVPNAQIANSGVYTVTVTNTSTSCTNTATVSVTVNAFLAMTASTNSPICAGSTLNLNSSTAQTPVTYSWSGPATITNSTAANATVPNAQPANSGVYTVTITNTSTSCSNTATLSVTVNPLPDVTANTNSPVCAGTTLQLNSNSVMTPVSYAWTGPATITNANSNNATVPNAAVANAGIYTVTVTNTSTNCANTATVSATVNALPDITTSTNSPICTGATLQLNSSSTMTPVSYSWSGPATITNSTNNNATVPNAQPANSGTYTITVTNTTTGCVNTATVNATINALPPITISSNSPICAGTTLQLNSSSTMTPVSYAWTGPATITNANSNNATVPNAVVGNSGTYTVTVTNTSTNCANTATVAATVNPLPPITTSSNSPICAGNTLQLNSSSTMTPVSYSWTGPATITNANSNNATVANAQPGNSGNYIVTVTNTGTNCSSTATITATINPLPDITESTNSPICAGSTLQLNSSSIMTPVSYSWTGPATITNANSNNATVANAQVANSGTYTITVTNTSTTCVKTATVSVTVNPLPTASITVNGPTTFCDGSSVLLTANTDIGNSFTWYNGLTQVGTGATYTATTSGNYTVQITNINGTTNCSATSAAVAVTVKTMPAMPAVQNNGPLCVGSMLQLSAVSTTAGSTYDWTGPASFVSNIQYPIISNVQLANAGVYAATATLNGCTSAAGTTNVIVYSIPPTPVASNNSQICPNTELDLFATDTFTSATFAWTGPNGFTSAQQNPVIANAPATDAGTYYVTATQNGCTSASAATDVVIAAFTTQVFASTDTTCTDLKVTLKLADTIPHTGIIYTWNFDGGTVLNGSGSGPYDVQWDSSGQKIVNVTAGYDGCNISTSDTVKVNGYVFVHSSVNSDVCLNQVTEFDVDYNNAPSPAWSWHWDFDGAVVMNGNGSQGPYQFMWTTPGKKVIRLIYSGDICMKANDDTVVVHDYPTATIAHTTNTNICTGDTVAFDALYVAGYKYAWTPASYFVSQNTTHAVGNIYQPGFVKLTVTDPFGCTNADSVGINARSCCDMNFPTAFSPNGDGTNDMFRPVNYGHHTIVAFNVVNRWGQTVFNTSDETKGWDGTFNGVPQEIGTYFWYIKYRCSDGTYNEKSGTVTLVR